jgi:hypothetical protein
VGGSIPPTSTKKTRILLSGAQDSRAPPSSAEHAAGPPNYEYFPFKAVTLLFGSLMDEESKYLHRSALQAVFTVVAE